MSGKPEVWLRGPVPGVAPLLQPAAHALLQAREELEAILPSLTEEEVRARPNGAASIGYHVRHLAGSLDRLLTYARAEMLDQAQLRTLQAETDESAIPTRGELLDLARSAIDAALDHLRHHAAPLDAPREVGRGKLPSTVIGLIFHAAEHTSRHVGQIVTTAKVVANS